MQIAPVIFLLFAVIVVLSLEYLAIDPSDSANGESQTQCESAVWLSI
jgi:hypothetical protein